MRHPVLTAIVFCLFGLIFSASADIPRIISYQGKVTDTSGIPAADGTYEMQFRIYDDPSGGTLLWDDTHPSVQVNDGVFSVALGESPLDPVELDFDQDYWLLVTIAGDDQTPRQRLGSVGYAYMASGLVPGTVVSGSVTSTPFAAIKGVNTAGTGDAYGIYGTSSSTLGRGIYGHTTATTGLTMGVYGESVSTLGRGVYVVKGISGFEVMELQGGYSSVAFDYRVMAKRKGFESKRLEYCQAAEGDSYLYPDLPKKELHGGTE